ncbi:uncharacterized protein LOC144121777 [Amblyomma americanum]
MADLPELQRRLLERSRLLGFEPYGDTPLRMPDQPSSEDDSGGSDNGCEDGACGQQLAVVARGTTATFGSPDREPLEPGRVGNTHWCFCGRCVSMPTALESTCCREIPAATVKQPSGCITEHPHFYTLCLDEVVLTVALQMLLDHGLRVEHTGRYRYISYSQLAHWLWGRLGRHHRKVLPACAVCQIRERFPSEGYTGFQYAQGL